jgi:DNA polymerase
LQNWLRLQTEFRRAMPKADQPTAAALLPPRRSLASLRRAAAACRACPLWKHATRTVFGEGPRTARLLLVGEQPGHEEDLAGRPFVGPAGRLLGAALDAAQIDRDSVYLTNAVKHFKWVAKGRVRLHQKPNAREVGACLPWLQAEIDLLEPHVIVCLGATAAQALLGRSFRVSRDRGRFVASLLAPFVMATVHPSSILRAPDGEQRRAGREQLIAELREVAKVLARAA